MEIFRIAQEKYAFDLSGNGARLYGGRWNSAGQFAVYAASSRALALLETLAHVPAKMLSNQTYLLLTIYVPDDCLIAKLDAANLPNGWNAAGPGQLTTRTGDQFLASKSHVMMRVPSVMVPEEDNFLINPLHHEMSLLKVTHSRRIEFDARLQEHL